MLSAVRTRAPSFWQLQSGGWIVMYLLLLLAAMPHLGERDILRYNTVACVLLFCATLAVRPLCRLANTHWTDSWFVLEGCVFAFSLVLGAFISFATGLGTFGWTRLNSSNWMLSGLQCAIAIFLWCNLYISIKRWKSPSVALPDASPEQGKVAEYATQFAIRTGSRIQLVYEENVRWISAARDYAELHTPSGTFLLRETMQSLEQRLDPDRFVRIHRSRIVRWDQIAELTAQENREYAVKLLDGSIHRSSRTYASILDKWLRSGKRARPQ